MQDDNNQGNQVQQPQPAGVGDQSPSSVDGNLSDSGTAAVVAEQPVVNGQPGSVATAEMPGPAPVEPTTSVVDQSNQGQGQQPAEETEPVQTVQ